MCVLLVSFLLCWVDSPLTLCSFIKCVLCPTVFERLLFLTRQNVQQTCERSTHSRCVYGKDLWWEGHCRCPCVMSGPVAANGQMVLPAAFKVVCLRPDGWVYCSDLTVKMQVNVSWFCIYENLHQDWFSVSNVSYLKIQEHNIYCTIWFDTFFGVLWIFKTNPKDRIKIKTRYEI